MLHAQHSQALTTRTLILARARYKCSVLVRCGTVRSAGGLGLLPLVLPQLDGREEVLPTI